MVSLCTSAYHTLLQVHKSILNQQPQYIYDNLNLRVHGKNQTFPHRQEYTVNTNRNLSISRAAFIYRGAHIWNMLPLHLRKCDKTPTFKNQVKQDQGSKAPSGHSSFYPCLPFYQSYLSIISFAPSTFITYLPFCQSYLSILSFAPSTFIPYLPFYQSYLSILSFTPSTFIP